MIDQKALTLEKVTTRICNFEKGVCVALLRLRNSVIDALYIRETINGEVKSQAVVDKIVESINKKTTYVMVNGSYVCYPYSSVRHRMYRYVKAGEMAVSKS